jgi:nicotinate-nucleotide adenylyltransferase
MTALGVLGGSFDPVHRGHLALASHARFELGIDRVVLLPCADPPHKPRRSLAPRYHRLEMLYLAVEGLDGIGISTFEVARGGHCYTIDTLRALRDGTPAMRPVFLLGSDALSDMEIWRDHDALLDEFDFAVAMRPGDEDRARADSWPDFVRRHEIAGPAAGLPDLGAGGRVVRLAVPELPASSSLVRRRIARGDPIVDLVPARVARYIQRHGMYAGEADR